MSNTSTSRKRCEPGSKCSWKPCSGKVTSMSLCRVSCTQRRREVFRQVQQGAAGAEASPAAKRQCSIPSLSTSPPRSGNPGPHSCPCAAAGSPGPGVEKPLHGTLSPSSGALPASPSLGSAVSKLGGLTSESRDLGSGEGQELQTSHLVGRAPGPGRAGAPAAFGEQLIKTLSAPSCPPSLPWAPIQNNPSSDPAYGPPIPCTMPCGKRKSRLLVWRSLPKLKCKALFGLGDSSVAEAMLLGTCHEFRRQSDPQLEAFLFYVTGKH